MGIRNDLEVLLCLAVVSIVCHQSEPRDYLFVKPRDFVKHNAMNKTRFNLREKRLLLQIHNSYRSLVLPSATNMRELVWDDDLEDYAWNHTQECTGAHSAGTMLKKYVPEMPESWDTWRYMGENLYYSFAPWYSIEEAMWMFWREGKDYDIENHSCTPGKECVHYRVTTLAHSTRVGCAMNTCNNFTVSRYPTPAVFFACSYDGEYLIYNKPYTVGARGSDCSYEKQTYDFQYYRNGLCISPKSYFFNTGFDGNTSVVGLPSPYLTPYLTSTTKAKPSTTAIKLKTTTTKAKTTKTRPKPKPKPIIITSAAPRLNKRSSTVTIHTTDNSTARATNFTGIVNRSSRPCLWLYGAASVLLSFILAIFN